jgi:hypothetical protein
VVTIGQIEGISDYLWMLRVELRREDRGEEALPLKEFARTLGAKGRSASSISKIESQAMRPSDRFLQEIAERYASLTDLAEMVRLRDAEFGDEDQWKESGEARYETARARALRESKGAPPPTHARVEPSPVAPPAQRSVEAPAMETISRERPLRSAHAVPVRSAPVVPRAAGEARMPVAPRRPESAVQVAAVQVAPVQRAAETAAEAAPDVEGGARHVVDEVITVVDSLATTLPAGLGGRYSAAVVAVADRLQRIAGARDAISSLDIRAAALAFAGDLWSIMPVSGAGNNGGEEDAAARRLLAVVRMSPKRSEIYDEALRLLRPLLGAADRGPDFDGALRLALVRAIALGAHR